MYSRPPPYLPPPPSPYDDVVVPPSSHGPPPWHAPGRPPQGFVRPGHFTSAPSPRPQVALTVNFDGARLGVAPTPQPTPSRPHPSPWLTNGEWPRPDPASRASAPAVDAYHPPLPLGTFDARLGGVTPTEHQHQHQQQQQQPPPGFHPPSPPRAPHSTSQPAAPAAWPPRAPPPPPTPTVPDGGHHYPYAPQQPAVLAGRTSSSSSQSPARIHAANHHQQQQQQRRSRPARASPTAVAAATSLTPNVRADADGRRADAVVVVHPPVTGTVATHDAPTRNKKRPAETRDDSSTSLDAAAAAVRTELAALSARPGAAGADDDVDAFNVKEEDTDDADLDNAEGPVPGETLRVRAYLQNTVVPVLLDGMTELVRAQPADPVQWLGAYLIANNPNCGISKKQRRLFEEEPSGALTVI